MRLSLLCVLAAGCGTQSTTAFALEPADCVLVNNLTVDGAATPWTDCRVFFSGAPYNVLTVQLTTPASMGSFTTPASTWARASVHAPGEIDTQLTPMPYATGRVLPTSIDETKMHLDLPLPCGNLGTLRTTPVPTQADVGETSVSFSMNLTGTCGSANYSGGFIISGSGEPGVADPNYVVTVP